MEFIFQILILIMSVVIHEVSHGYAASALGDDTARYQGRLTLNPLNHLDPMGSFIIPFLTYSLGGFIIGWARPVPYNPHNLRPGRFSEAMVAGAGPLSNIIVAIIFAIFLRLGVFPEVAALIIFINIILAVFNLIPIPPLDGSKILFAFLPSMSRLRGYLEQSGFIILLLFIFFAWQYFFPIVTLVFRFLTGLSL